MDWTWSTTVSLFITLIISLVFQYILKKYQLYKKSPPGPWGLPFIGSLLTLNRENALLKIQEYKKIYGKIFSLNVGNFSVVVINDYKLIHDALKREEFLGRPDFETYVVRNDGVKNRGVLFTDGTKNWNEQRRFTLRTLRDFGFGKQSMDGLLLHEVEELVQHFKKEYIGKPVNLKHSFNRSVFNSVWYIISGQRFESTDPVFKKMIALFTGCQDCKVGQLGRTENLDLERTIKFIIANADSLSCTHARESGHTVSSVPRKTETGYEKEMEQVEVKREQPDANANVITSNDVSGHNIMQFWNANDEIDTLMIEFKFPTLPSSVTADALGNHFNDIKKLAYYKERVALLKRLEGAGIPICNNSLSSLNFDGLIKDYLEQGPLINTKYCVDKFVTRRTPTE